ncbi:purine-nucleoside phosphorylase [Prosthecomicrobium pneumaticum]|uniref:Purine nucleoside phosphorylase n=1 Tax=Prosthecomicrobium pneumaticum TaxID=81895 RepID=A0A7W9FND9_9HYPH|nr:purine-nucleoside phosphorylase [Prosthecomicrobium pneumaticum]MBB5753895.1 purine-nucleoside phosphorylase [Prosthecomicrobium pneumaticum]
MTRDDGRTAAALVRSRKDLPFRLGLVLGSGLGGLADAVEDAAVLPYETLPGMPVSRVSSHRGAVVAGRLEGVPVVVLAGRAHYYESGDAAVMRDAIGMLKALGCEGVVLTNAAGSLREDLPPATPMLVTDHIALSGRNPLIGEETDARFVGLSAAYDAGWRSGLAGAAAAEGEPLGEGVYMWFSGPSFETPAEIRMARLLGADAVGMSTVPEVILARFFGLKVAAVSILTNYGAGMRVGELSHDETKEVAPRGAAKLERILRRFLRDRFAAPSAS